MLNQDNFDIDNLKKAWQEQEIPDDYNQSEIEAMINKKSRNYVKYILWISLAEFLIFGIINFIAFMSNNIESDFSVILQKLRIQNQNDIVFSLDKVYLGMKILSLIITGVFVVIFYKNYKKIAVESNIKKFIRQIIVFKNTVNLFIVINIIILVLFLAGFISFLIMIINQQNIEVDNPTFFGLLTGLVLGLVISVVLIMVYYKVAYGILLKRLSSNMDQLIKLDKEKD